MTLKMRITTQNPKELEHLTKKRRISKRKNVISISLTAEIAMDSILISRCLTQTLNTPQARMRESMFSDS